MEHYWLIFWEDVFHLPTGDQTLKIYWDHVLKDPEKFKFKNHRQALDDAQTQRIVVWVAEDKVRSYLKENPHATTNLKIFGQKSPKTNHMLLPKNSPLTLMFRHGFRRLRENGIFDYLQYKWLNVPDNRNRLSLRSRHVVGIGQIVLIFYIKIAIIGTVVLVLGLEILWHKQDIVERWNAICTFHWHINIKYT